MLSVAKLAARAEDYYLRTVAAGREEYYTGSGEAPGYWLGEAARRLGLVGEVTPEDLRAVLAGVAPDGRSLTAGRVDPAKRVAGFDLTWSAPKSVSLLYGLSSPEVSATVREVHADAVSQALGYLERRALALRRGAGGQQSVGAHGLVAGAFLHRTSRAGDPQLHTHVLVANVAEGLDGEWSAPDARLLYFHARTAGFLYQAALRAGLSDVLGVRFAAVTNGAAELEGISKTLLRGFSTRRRQIEQHLAVIGSHSARATEAAALITRPAKEPHDTEPSTEAPVGLFERWRARAAELGLALGPSGHIELGDLALGPARTPLEESQRRALVGQTLGAEGLTASDAAFERRDVVRTVAASLGRGGSVAEVEALADLVLADPSVVALGTVGRGGEGRSSTLELLALEATLVTTALGRNADGAGVVAAATLDAALARFSMVADDQLADEQVAMVRRLARSGAGVEAVVGQAGAGKTLALAAAREAWESAGFRVLGTGLSARAARGLRDGAGIESGTLAGLGLALERGEVELGPRDVVVADEAGMIGTRDLARLVEVTAQAHAKLVLVGDPRQLPEIEAGGAFAGLIARLGAIELRENRRQEQDWERRALSHLRMGWAGLALDVYDRAGRIHTADSLPDARSEMVKAWLGCRDRGEDAVMLAVTRGDIAELNAAARRVRAERGELGPDLLEIDGIGFALGDEVLCLRNDRRIGVMNGTLGTITGTRGQVMVISTRDGEVSLPETYLADGYLGHAYAMTIHKAQGATVDRAFVLGTESLTREAGYVAMSRARKGSELFVPTGLMDQEGHDPRQIGRQQPLEGVTRHLATSRAKQLASDELIGVSEPSVATDVCNGGQPGMSMGVSRGERSVPDRSVPDGDDATDNVLDRTRSLRIISGGRAVDFSEVEPDRGWGLGL